ncbi:Y+L amino acid transporter 2-like [Ixodes scapularis]|uniref:Y+L amino acid transporter 2-like n=1 Tax=Ixodes scapularis TaxID=6945 RepID=UPI001A9DE77A|nr:Y+L amino acid transporter 2-like [Ixodes scapularis]
MRAPDCDESAPSSSTSGFESDPDGFDPKTPTFRGSKAFLRREVGLLGTISLLVGAAAGSGIFVTPGIVYRNAGSVGVALVVWGISGCFAMVGGLCYAELGAMLPVSGGAYSCVAEASKSLGKPGEFIRFMYAWSYVMLADPMTATLHALTISSYVVGILYPTCSAPYVLRLIVTLIFTCMATAINSFSVKVSSRVQGVLSTVKCLILVTIIVTGAIVASSASHLNDAPMFTPDTTYEKMVVAFYACNTSYAGWQSIVNIGGEMKDPRRSIPLALVAGLSIVTVLSLLVNVAYFAVLGPVTVAGSEAIAVSFAFATWGMAGAVLVALAVTISTFGALCAGFFSNTRVILAVARRGHLPSIFGSINVNSSVPLTSLLLRSFLAQVYASTGSVERLLPNMVFLYSSINVLLVCSFFVLRFTMRDALRPYRVPTVFPVLWLVFLVLMSVSPLARSVQHMQYGVMIAVVLSGAVYYALFVHFELSLPGARVVTCFVQKLLACAPCFSDLDVPANQKSGGRANKRLASS